MGRSFPETVDFLIAGAGVAGIVLAERLASQCGKTSLIVDRRSHIGGNCHDGVNSEGILTHTYGPHYFRTNSNQIVDYLSRFTEWHHVDYHILSSIGGKYWQFPINLNTFEQFIGRPSTTGEMEELLAKWRVDIPFPKNSEEMIVSQVGWELYELFFKNYTKKQWRRDPKDLDPSVCGRIPIRTNRDNRYLSEKFQALPRDGYTAMFDKMLAHPLIQVALQTDYRDVPPSLKYKHLIYTGMIDEFYQYRFGPLPYRSLRFEPETLDTEYWQPVVQVNYPNEYDFTRIVEIKHATGQIHPRTTIVREYPDDFGPGREPYYPVPSPSAKAIYNQYAEVAKTEKHVSFVGRLATYRYYNIDQVIGMALREFQNLSESYFLK